MSGDPGRCDRPQLEDLVHRARIELRDWTDMAGHDPGVALLELFAFVGEMLTTYSERVANEAHLGSERGHTSADDRITVEVDGCRWQQVRDFAGSGAEDAHYVVDRNGDGASVIEFGDGVHGRRPSSDITMTVRYKHDDWFSSVVLQQGRVIIDAAESEEPSRPTCGVYRATVLDNADPLLQSRLLVRAPEVSGDEALWAAACFPAPGAGEIPATGTEIWVALESGDPSRPVWLGQRVTT